jgi:hypothetical protein
MDLQITKTEPRSVLKVHNFVVEAPLHLGRVVLKIVSLDGKLRQAGSQRIR